MATDRCANCRRVIWKPVRDELGLFCSMECRNYVAHPDFCAACISSSLPKSSGRHLTINAIGTHFFGRKDPCPTCYSVVQTKCFCILFIPIARLGTYRVKYEQPGRFVSRRVWSAGT